MNFLFLMFQNVCFLLTRNTGYARDNIGLSTIPYCLKKLKIPTNLGKLGKDQLQETVRDTNKYTSEVQANFRYSDKVQQ